jgi:Bacterial Ig domain/Dockerin type I domain
VSIHDEPRPDVDDSRGARIFVERPALALEERAMKRLFSSSSSKSDRSRRQARDARPMLEGLEDRLVLSLVAVSPSDAKINVTSPLGQTVPSVAMDANGDYVVAWNNQVHQGPNYLYDVEARVYNSAGQAQTGEIVVAQTKGDTRPSVAMDANGDFVVAYQVLNTTTYLYGISAQRFNLAGSPQGSALVLNNGSSDSAAGKLPKVAMDSTGDFVIAYQGYDSNSHGVFAQQFNPSGASQGSIFRVNTPQNDNQGAESIAMDSAGDFVIAWEDGGPLNGNPGQTAGVYAQRYTYKAGSTGPTVNGSNTAISTTAGSSNPSVAMEPTGQYAIAYQFAPFGAPGIEAQRFDASGNALTNVVPLSTPESYFQLDPSVAIDGEGDFLVAWESYGQGGTASLQATILAQRVNSGGTLIGTTQFLPSTQSGDGQTSPELAANAGGNTIVVWQNRPSTSSAAQNVFGRLYDYVNEAPTINTPSNVTINENAGQQTVNLAGIAAGGGETQVLTVTASSNNTALINPTVTYTSPNSTGILTFTPAANSFGTATITVTVTDNGGTLNGGVNQTSVQFAVTVNAVIPPKANAQTVSVPHDSSGTGITLTGSDSNSPSLPLTFAIATQPAHGTLSGLNSTTGAVTYTPAAGYHGSDTFTFTASDSNGKSSPATVTLIVAVGTPVAFAQTAPVAHDSTGTPIMLDGSDDDAPPLTLTFAFTQPSHGSVIVSGAAGSPTVIYTPTPGYHGSDNFAFTVSNGTNISAAATVTLNVAVGTPKANSQSVSTNQNTPLNITLTGSDDDTPALSLTYVFTQPSHGMVTVSGAVGSPTVVYTPSPGVTGPDSFTFTVSNGTNSSTSATVSLMVNPPAQATVSGDVGITWGTAGTATLQTNADGLRLLPSGRSTDLDWLGINTLQITLSQAETLSASDVTVTGVNIANYGPVTISGSGTNYVITLSQPINAADRVTMTISNANIATFTRRLDVLPGDFNDDGVVNAQDATLVRNEYLGLAGAMPLVTGDITGDGIVDVNDYNTVRRLIGTRLP